MATSTQVERETSAAGAAGLKEAFLYRAARLFSRTELAHSADMQAAQRTLAANNSFRGAQARLVTDQIRRFALPFDGQDILDLGCNDGALTIRYKGPNRIIGVDVDARAIARAQVAHARDDISYLVAGRTTLPVHDRSIDGIVCYDVFEHVADPLAILTECARVLRPGGWMLIGTWGWGHPFAPHLWATMPVPWAHQLVSEAALLRVCRRVYESTWYRPTFHDFDAEGRRLDKYLDNRINPEYLNKFYVRDFERVFAASTLDWRLSVEPFGKVRWTRPLLRWWPFREYAHGYLWAVLHKPDTRER